MPDPNLDVRSSMEKRAAAVLKQHRASQRSRRRASGLKTLAIVGLGVGLAWSVYNNQKLAAKAEGKEVVYAVIQQGGDVVSSVHYDELPPSARQPDAVQNALWLYVQARDCYNGPGFARASYIAQAMSEARVGRQVRAEFDLGNPDAPQHLFGERGITVQCEMVDPPMPMGGSGDVLFFRFRRWLDSGHVSPADIAAAPFYSVAVRYRTGIYPDDPRRRWVDKSTFNAPGVQVLDYPGSRPDNARPSLRMSLRTNGAQP